MYIENILYCNTNIKYYTVLDKILGLARGKELLDMKHNTDRIFIAKAIPANIFTLIPLI